MSLFKNLAARFKLQNREAKAAEIKREGPPPYLKAGATLVPQGHVMPLGAAINDPFHIVWEAGVRWHPEWEEPRITVNAWRTLPQGDAVGWAGPSILAFRKLLPADVVELAEYHGQTVTPSAKLLLDRMGLATPKVQQTYSSFNSFRQLDKRSAKVSYR